MRWLILADVHANLPALEAVLAAAEGEADALACCGDLVGYGPDPEACVLLLRARGAVCVAGNHDRMAAGLAPPRGGQAALRALEWTRAALSEETRRWLAGLPACRRLEPGLALCHGSPGNAERYLDRPARVREAAAELARLQPGAWLLLYGHTHRQGWWRGERFHPAPPWPLAVQLPVGGAALVNPGAVGQSRDRRLLARFALLDAEAGRVEFRAVPYDHRRCRERLRAAGLASPLRRNPAQPLRELAEPPVRRAVCALRRALPPRKA